MTVVRQHLRRPPPSQKARVVDIYPQDLGDSNYARVLNKRRVAVGTSNRITPRAAHSFPPAPLTLTRKLWMQGTAIEEQAAEHATPAFDLCGSAAVQIMPAGFRWNFWRVAGYTFVANASSWMIIPFLSSSISLWSLLFCLCFLLMLFFGVLRPRRVFQQMHRRLDYEDFTALESETRDPLASDFLRLVQAATKMSEAENSIDTKKIRRAFYELGNSISLLPPLEIAAEDAIQLQAEAQQLEGRAETEADQVVAASFQRQAEAVLQRAALAGHNNMISRRSQVLREELREQIGALRATLTATHLGPNHYAGGLANVAASIQQIAAQASSVAAAQAELEGAYAVPAPDAFSAAAGIPRHSLRNL